MRSNSSMISVVFEGSRLPVGSSQSKNLRIVDQRARDRGALLFAAGEFARIHAALVRESDEIERARHLAHDVFGVRAGHLHCKRDVLPDRLVAEQFEILEDDAEMSAQRGDAAAAQAARRECRRR